MIDPDTPPLKNKPTPSDNARPHRPTGHPDPRREVDPLNVADLHQWSEPSYWPPLQLWDEWFNEPWPTLPEWH